MIASLVWRNVSIAIVIFIGEPVMEFFMQSYCSSGNCTVTEIFIVQFCIQVTNYIEDVTILKMLNSGTKLVGCEVDLNICVEESKGLRCICREWDLNFQQLLGGLEKSIQCIKRMMWCIAASSFSFWKNSLSIVDQ
jgi:hypothetical protein